MLIFASTLRILKGHKLQMRGLNLNESLVHVRWHIRFRKICNAQLKHALCAKGGTGLKSCDRDGNIEYQLSFE